MKKVSILIILLLISNIISISLIKAQDEDLPGMPVSESDLEKIENITSNIPIDEQGNLDESKVAGWKSKIEEINNNYIQPAMETLNPFFKLVLGAEYSFSYAFVFAVIIWLILFFIIFPIASVLFGKWYFGFIASFAITSLIGLSGVIKKAAEMISTMITTWWLALIALIAAIIIGVLLYLFSKLFKNYIKKQKEQEKAGEQEKNREILKTSADIEKQRLGSYKDSRSGI